MGISKQQKGSGGPEGGHSGHAPPPRRKANHRGLASFAPPPRKPRWPPWTSLGPMLRSILFQVSGSCGTDQGPAGTNQDPAGRIRASRDGLGSCSTDRGSAGRSRARLTNQGLQDKSALRTSQGTAGRIRSPRDVSEPRRMNQGPWNRAGPMGTNQGPPGRIRGPKVGHFSFIFHLVCILVSDFRPLPINSGSNPRSF